MLPSSHERVATLIEPVLLGLAFLAAVAALSLPAARSAAVLPWLLGYPLCALLVARVLRLWPAGTEGATRGMAVASRRRRSLPRPVAEPGFGRRARAGWRPQRREGLR